MCGIAGYSLGSGSSAEPYASPRRRCWPGSPNGAPTPSGMPTAAPGGALEVHKQQTGAERAARAASPSRPTPRRCSCTCGTSRRAHPTIPRQQPSGPARPVTGDPQRDHRQRRRALRPSRPRAAHEPEMTVDSEAIFALVDEHRQPARDWSSSYGAMAAAWIDERDPEVLYARAWHRTTTLDRSRQTRGALRLDARRARGRRARPRHHAPQDARSPKDACSRSSTAGSWARSAGARRSFREERRASRGARAARGPLLPRAARSDRRRWAR